MPKSPLERGEAPCPEENDSLANISALDTGKTEVPSLPLRQRTSDAESLKAIQSWVYQQYGLTFSETQHSLFLDRILTLCAELRVVPAELLSRLTTGHRQTVLALAEAVSTNYTYFRREPQMFDFMAREVFPALPEGELRIWSAATSSGDEAYSLAIAALEHFGSEALARVRVLGTDLSERQIRFAERGIYPMEQVKSLGSDRIQRWFEPTAQGQFSVSDELRSMCLFRRMNLTNERWPFRQRFHVIFLRNVLYYFDEFTRARILEKCFDAATDEGILMTSLTEPLVVDVSTRWRASRPAVFTKTRTRHE